MIEIVRTLKSCICYDGVQAKRRNILRKSMKCFNENVTCQMDRETKTAKSSLYSNLKYLKEDMQAHVHKMIKEGITTSTET